MGLRENFVGQLKKLRSKKLYLGFFSSMLLAFLFSMAAYTALYSIYFAPRFEEKLTGAQQDYYSKLSLSFDLDLEQLREVAVQVANDSCFSAYYLNQHQYSCFEVTKTLASYQGCNPQLLDIVYVCRDNPYIYTSVGAYNTAYYEPQSVVSRSLQSGALWESSFLPTVEWFTKDAQRQVLEYVVPVRHHTAAVIFQLDAKRVTESFISRTDQENGMLLLDGGRKVFSVNLPPELEQMILSDFSAGSLESGLYGSEYYLYRLSSSQPGVDFIFLTPYYQLVNEYAAMNGYFLLFSLGFMVLCLAITLLLAHWHYRPIQRLRIFFGQVVEDIPSGYSEVQTFAYAMNRVVTHKDFLLREKVRASQERILRQLVEGGEWDLAAMDLQCQEAGIDIADRSCCVLLLGARDYHPVPEQAKGAFSGCLDQAGIRFYSVDPIERNSSLYLCVLPEEGESALYEMVRQSVHGLFQNDSEKFFISVGSACRGYQDVARSYREARLTAQLQERFPNETVLEYLKLQPVNSGNYVYPSVEIDGLCSAIVSRNSRQIQRLTDLLVKRASEGFGHDYLSRCLCYDIANAMLRAVNQLERVSDRPLSIPILPDLMEFQRFSDFEDFIRSMEAAIISQLGSTQPQSQDLCAQIVQYIKENIHSPDLCIKTLCSRFHISQSTLSSLFREKMGTTVAGYIGALRSEYVKSLLVSTDLPISEITRQLGYSQPSSFIRQFKNAEGITPGEYRQKYRSKEK